jgi:hypothetical protein
VCSLTLEDSKWLSTFPHLVTPLPGEWLPGLLLRCDEENGWSSGTTALLVSNHLQRRRLNAVDYVVAEHLNLIQLAEFLDLPSSALLDTTFRPALQRLYGRIHPLGLDLGLRLRPRICPACLDDARLFHFSLALPLVEHCPLHNLVFQRKCSCARPLKLFFPKTNPFTCPECRQDWSKLARISVSSSQRERETRYISFYTYFLTQESLGAIKRAYYLIEEERTLTFLLSPQRLSEPRRAPSFVETVLEVLVMKLVNYGFSVRDIVSNVHSQARGERRCLNWACTCFEAANESNSALYGHYLSPEGFEEPIWFCKVCGSCFLSNRLCLTFDQECMSDDPNILYPSEHSITKAQEALEEWKHQLQTACFMMSEEGQKITVEQAFARANIPAWPNLRATRLGLVEIVQWYVSRQQ